jgi:hypothetical protein
MGILSGDAIGRWLLASCELHGVPVKVTDVRIVDQVRILLGGGTGGPGRSARLAGSPDPRL